MTRKSCQFCGRKMVLPAGPPRSPIALVGEFPGKWEVRRGVPWVGQAGDILRSELAMAGIPMDACRLMNLWTHAKNDDPDDYAWHMEALLEELSHRKAALMMGSDIAKAFQFGKVSEVNGFVVKSKLFPDNLEVAVASLNPAIAMHGVIGEVRFSVGRFAELARRYL